VRHPFDVVEHQHQTAPVGERADRAFQVDARVGVVEPRGALVVAVQR
jgi:hypothetical protein